MKQGRFWGLAGCAPACAVGLFAVFAACFEIATATQLMAQEELESPPPIPEESRSLEEPPPLPPKVQDEHIEPAVTIREEEDRRIEEYSYNGSVYMVKITPKGGVPYYYIDTDGDGRLELDEDQRALNPVLPVYWKVKEWK